MLLLGEGDGLGKEGQARGGEHQVGKGMNADAGRRIGIAEYSTGSVRHPGRREFPA